MSLYIEQPIHSDDPNVVEKLTQRKERLKERNEFIKAANQYYMEHGTTYGCEGINVEFSRVLDASAAKSKLTDKVPYPPYQITQTNREISRLEKKIEKLTKNPTPHLIGWKFDGGEAVANVANDMLELYFSDKPDEKQRAILKIYGFEWSANDNAWQRKLIYHAVCAADRIDFIQPLNGQKPTEIQPKQPTKDEPER